MSARQTRPRRNELAGGNGIDLSALEIGRPILIGSEIENPGNVAALRAAAEMFDWDFGLVDSNGRAGMPPAVFDGVRTLSRTELAALSPIVAVENAVGAEDIYGFRPPPRGQLVVIVGNERKGIARDVLELACRTVRIPVASVHINTINVAAAAAIALYFISRGGGQRLRARGEPHRSRPELLIAGPTDAMEVGSVVRTAACFGWPRLFLDDRHGAWFASDRVTRSLGRGAARRGRNAIHVIPARADGCGAFDEVCVVTARGDGEPLQHVDLARGPRQLVVLPDDSSGNWDSQQFSRLGRRVRQVRIDGVRDVSDRAYRRFRLTASIALAEVARQVGARRRGHARDETFDGASR
jgi:tRNA G18 (ribose-2'-O)-methylase SpoU